MDLTTKASAVNKISIKLDPETIKSIYTRPSTDKDNPTGLGRDEVSMSGIGSDEDAKIQEGTDLTFDAGWGDVVSFSPITTPDKSLYTASIDRVVYYAQDQVFSQSRKKGDSIELRVQQPGTTMLMIQFGIYTKDDSGNPKNLFGYFYFNPSITIR